MGHTDRLIIIEEGKIVSQGKFSELQSHPLLQSITVANHSQKETEERMGRVEEKKLSENIENFELSMDILFNVLEVNYENKKADDIKNNNIHIIQMGNSIILAFWLAR